MAKKTASLFKSIVKAENPNLIVRNRQPRYYRFTRSNINSTTVESLTSVHTVTPNTTFIPQPANSTLNNTVTQAVAFLLNDVVQTSEFSTLFARFRLRKIDVTVNMVDSLANSAYQPSMTVFKLTNPNLTSSTVNASVADQVANIMKMQFSNEHRSFTKSFYPYTLDITQGASVNYASNIKYGQWFDLQTIGTVDEPVYYGLGFVVQNLTGSTVGAIQFTIDVVYHIEVSDVV